MPSSSEHITLNLLSLEQAKFIAENFAALGDPSRARILFALIHGEHSVNALAEIAEISPSAVSHHLNRLRSLRLVKTRRAANQVFYIVDDSHVELLFQEMLSHLDHIKRSLPDHSLETAMENLDQSPEALAHL